MDIVPNVTIENLETKYENVVVKDKSGTEIKSGAIGTGCTVTIQDKTYKVVKKGDANGDGNVTVVDAVLLLNAVKGDTTLENEFKEAACVKNEEKFTVADAVLMLNYVKGTGILEVK